MTTKTNWRVPAAKLVLPATAPRQDWLNARTTGLGGSDVAIAVGASTFKTPFDLWQAKTSTEPPVEEVKDIFWYGQKVEPLLAERFTADTGIATRNVGMYQSKTVPHELANPDRLTADGGVLEIKTTGGYTDRAKEWQNGIVPADAFVQGQWYLHVTGRSHVWYIALVDRVPHIIGPVERDTEMIEQLTDAAAAFWRCVETGTPPPIDLATVTPDELEARHPEVLDPESAVEADMPALIVDDLSELAEVKAAQDELAAKRKTIETRIKAAIGDHEYLTVDGRPVARWQQIAGRKSFDKAAVLAKIAADRGMEGTKQELKDIENEYTKVGAPTRRLTIIEDAA